MARPHSSRQVSYILALMLAVAAIAVLYLAKIVVLPLALAILFTFLLAPLVTALERAKVPRVIGILLVITVFAGILGYIGWLAGNQLVEVAADLPAYRVNIADKLSAVHKANSKNTKLSRAEKEIERLGHQLGISEKNPPLGRGGRTRGLAPSTQQPVSVQQVGSGTALNTLHGAVHVFVFILLVAVFTFFMLLQREDLRNRMIRLTGRGHLNMMTQAMDEASERVSRYFALQLLVNTCYGLIVFTALHFIALPHALLFGALAGLLRFIPYIGAPIAGLLPTLLSIAVFHGWIQTLLIVALFFCLEIVTANFVEPHLYGRQTGLSPLAVLVAAVFWTLLWGPIGLILSVPLTVCVTVVGAHVPQLEFLKVLLGDQPVMRPEARYYQRLLAGDEREAGEVLEDCLKEMPLTKLYDSVLIPAFSLAEQDRHRNALDDATVDFIYQTTEDLIQDLGLSDDKELAENPADSSDDVDRLPAEMNVPMHGSMEIWCIPVRDKADEVAALMLAQLLERAGHRARLISLAGVDRAVAEISDTRPDLAYLSAVPPYTMSHARNLYGRLRAVMGPGKIAIGLWQYGGDPVQAARRVSRGEQEKIHTSLTAAVSDLSAQAAVTS